MDEKNEKYLATMLEGYEQNLGPLNAAMNQLQQQMDGLKDQRDTMETGIVELKELLGLSEEEEAPTIEEGTDDEE